MNHIWDIKVPDNQSVQRLVKALGVSPLLAQCLVNRELAIPDEAKSFLNPTLADLVAPELIPNMAPAVDRLLTAREKGETVVVFGDYDVDGITSTTILLDSLNTLGWRIAGYLPDRVDEGYGLTSDGVANCLTQLSPDVMIAADCGTNSLEVITSLREQGVDVIVLDHHQAYEPHPPAVALVNPWLAQGDEAKFRELCTAGLAFKLLHAVVKRGRQLGLTEFKHYDIRQQLDLVGLGTIADLVPLTGENRILAFKGLQQIPRTQRPGLRALLEVAGIDGSVGSFEAGFQIAPRINAAGRLQSAMRGLDLLRSENRAEAEELAGLLDRNNRDRQRVEKEITKQVLDTLKTQFNPERDHAIVMGDTGWNIGVVGIVASRVQKEFYRPTFILGGSPDGLRGSGRSIKGFDLAAALKQCDGVLDRYGGHAMAAGVSMQPENLGAFRDRLNEVAKDKLAKEMLQPTLKLDGTVPLHRLNLSAVESLEALQPTGMGVPNVQVAVPQLELNAPVRWMGAEKQHAKLSVTDGQVSAEVVCWNAKSDPLPEGRFDLAAHPSINLWRGRRSLQLKMLDWRPAA